MRYDKPGPSVERRERRACRLMERLPTPEPLLCSECGQPIRQNFDDHVIAGTSEDPHEQRLQFTHVDCHKPSHRDTPE